MAIDRPTKRLWLLQCAVMGVATAAAAVSLAGIAGPTPDGTGVLGYRVLVSTTLVLGWPAWAVWSVLRATGMSGASWHGQVAVLAALCVLQWAGIWAAGWANLRRGKDTPSPILLALLVGGAVVVVMFSWRQG